MLDGACGGHDKNNPATWLDRFPVWRAMSGDGWQRALDASTIVSFAAGTPLLQCGEQAEHFVIVLHGVVRVYETAESGREICLYRVRSGEICVLTVSKLLKAKGLCAQAIAEQDVRLLIMPLEHFYRLMATSERFRLQLMAAMANCLSDIMHLVSQVSFQRLDLRLARFIARLARQQSSSLLKFTHQDVANELGTTREVVSRLLKDLEHMGCVRLSRGNIRVVSVEALQKGVGDKTQ